MEDSSIELIEENLKKLLIAINKTQYYGKFYYILRELVENAERANAKRIYAERKSLNLSRLSDSPQLKDFITSYKEELTCYRDDLKRKKLFIRIELKVRNNNIIIRVTNNSEISDTEKKRIEQRINKSFQISNMREAARYLRDKKESSGLGIISVILALKHIGGSVDSIQFYTHLSGHTIVQINLPVHVITDENIMKIAAEVQETISDIPKIPDNLVRILEELRKTKPDIPRIANLIKKDPGLSVDILKTVNSGLYMLPNKVSNVNQAVTLLGLKGIKSIVSTTATKEVFKFRKDIDEIWKHSYTCAKYSQVIAEIFNMTKIYDDLILSGFLHDIGKIIMLGDAGITKIEEYINNSRLNIQNTKIEEIFFVLNHAIVSSEIAHQWGFSPEVIASLKYHHDPKNCKKDDIPFVYTTFLANIFIGIKNGRYNITEVPLYVMEFFKCNNLDELEILRNKVEETLQKKLAQTSHF
jgi:HD-like signal output (HDOD) protein